MIRVEQLQERGGGLYVVGKFTLIEDTAFALTGFDTAPMFFNAYTIRFPSAQEPYVVTHIGFFPVTEYTGLVMRLTTDRAVPRLGDLSFPVGSITMAMENGATVTTVQKGTP